MRSTVPNNNLLLWVLLLLPLAFFLNSCENREDRINRKQNRLTGQPERTQKLKSGRHHGDDRIAKEVGEISADGGVLQNLLKIEGSHLVFRDGREIALLGVADNSTTESYLRQAFSDGLLQEPFTFRFDSHDIPRRPQQTKILNGYATDVRGVAINGMLLREKVSPYILDGTEDSTYAFEQYTSTNYKTKPGFDVDLMRSTTFQVRVLDTNGNQLGTGSGFFIAENGIGVSNFHVFENGDRFELIRCSDGQAFTVRKIIDYSQSDDWLIFSVRPDDAFKYLKIAEAPPEQGEQIYVFGNPRDLTCSLTKGIVSALREEGDRIQIDAAISPGNSGSPVVNENNEVIGIATYKQRDCESCNFAVNVELFAHYFQE